MLRIATLCWLIFVSAAAAQTNPIGIGTGPQGTMTFSAGAALSKVLLDAAGMQSRIQPSTGNTAMIPLIGSGEIDIGFGNVLELHEAYHGLAAFNGRAQSKLRAVAVVFPIRTSLFVRADSPITSIEDLKGKTIPYGFAAQDTIRRTIDAILASGGLTAADMRTVLVPNVLRGAEEFTAGRVDATTFVIGAAKVSEIDAAVKIRWLPLPDSAEARAAMRKEYPGSYISEVLPQPGLAGVEKPIKAMAFDYVLFANADVPAATIRKMLDVLAESGEMSLRKSPVFKDFSVNRMFSELSLPYHDAALAYFREKGLKKVSH